MRSWWLLSALVLGCRSDVDLVDPSKAFGLPNPQTVPDQWWTDRLVQMTIPAVDVLFVVDNSCSMDAEQVLLGENFPPFFDWFEASALDYHIGVVSTDMVDPLQAGRLREVNGRKWIDRNTPSPEVLFQNMVEMGTSGHWEEKGRAATYTAIDLLGATDNIGFARPLAGMHVTVVSDENDDSGDSPISRDEFVDWMLNLRWSRRLVSFSSIVGPTSGCPNIGSPGTEYMEVTRQVGGVVWPICSDDWSEMLDELGFIAVGLSREFYLSHVPVADTIEVLVEDGPTTLTFDRSEWAYDEVRNSIEFTSLVPSPLATVVVTYQLQSSNQGPQGGGGTTPTE